jgi:hypothetical protein
MIRDNTLNPSGNGAIVLGGVYHGTCMPDLDGQLFFGNYTTGDVHSIPASSTSIAFTSATDYTSSLDPNHGTAQALLTNMSSFGFDGSGELYIASFDVNNPTAVYRIEVQ